MPGEAHRKAFDLEERTFQFALRVCRYCKTLPGTVSNTQYVKQARRSSGSVGANYIEANESLGKRDFLMRIKICRKESKETSYWLRLIRETNPTHVAAGADSCIAEADELKRIFSAIVNKFH